jgi:phospholipid-binding lipoprotein MlaA
MKNRAPTFVYVAIASVLMGGCASTVERDPRDPLEPMNRAVSSFNDVVDRGVFKPLAKGYKAVTPQPVKNGIRNVFSNLDDVTEFANNLLQFKVQDAASDLMRVTVNTSFGLLGLFDVASEMRLQKHNEDFGQTLGHWGVNSGPYLVLPIFGPSSFRDGVGLAVDSNFTNPIYQMKDVASRNETLGAQFISRRADLLESSKLLEEAAFDKYTFTRDFYLDRRQALVYDGKPPASVE